MYGRLKVNITSWTGLDFCVYMGEGRGRDGAIDGGHLTLSNRVTFMTYYYLPFLFTKYFSGWQMYTLKIKLFETQRTMQFLPKSFLSSWEIVLVDLNVLKTTEGFGLRAKASNWRNKLLLQMAILTGYRYLHFSLKWKDIFPKKVSRDFSYVPTYLTLKYDRNQIFHPCCVMFEFYRHALLKIKKMETKLNIWLSRDLTLFGRTLLAKSLGSSQLIDMAFLLSVLESVIQQTQSKLFAFLWKHKRDRNKRQVLVLPLSKGGLGFPCFRTAIKALRLSWIGRLLSDTDVI